jgi:hypothetical protein
MQDIDAFSKFRDVQDSVLKLRVNPNFSNAPADNRNRFPVVWIKPLLNSTQLKSGKPARVRRKSPELVEGGS